MAKKTIKEMYAEYGINYDPKTGKIFCEPLGIWVPEMITVGTNTKVGDAGTFSILHGNDVYLYENLGPKAKAFMDAAKIKEIKGTCPCHCKDCYCDSGRYPSDNVRAALVIRTIIVRTNLGWFKNAVIAQILVRGIKRVRIHAAGDFFSVEYTNTWREIIIATHVVTENDWSYTKWEHAEHAFDDLEGMSLVPSLTPFGVNYGTCGYLLKLREKLINAGHRVHICACGTEYEKTCAECKVGCKEKGVYTLFILHSSREYTAGKNDPEDFAAIKEIIRNQYN